MIMKNLMSMQSRSLGATKNAGCSGLQSRMLLHARHMMARTRPQGPPKAASADTAAAADKDGQLLSAWQRCSTLLTASGSLELSASNPLRLFYVKKGQEPASNPAGLITFPLTDDTAAIQGLVDAATVSPFGKGNKTVVDTSVRTAVEIKAPQLALNKVLPPTEVLEEVRVLLAPNASSLVAELDKLNIYGTGGFFKPHYDTPRSEDHIGTLIICLPVPFSGGQLVLRHVDHNQPGPPPSVTFDWSTGQGQPRLRQQQLQWAAFYGDTEHEVLPVTQGHRITLTYNLRALHQYETEAAAAAAAAAEEEDLPAAVIQQETATQPLTGVSDSSSSSRGGGATISDWMTAADVSAAAELTGKLQKLLSDDTWHSEGGCLGFVLQHKYTSSLRDIAGLSFPQALKGPDRVLAAALTQAGLKFRVVPLFRAWSGSSWGDDEYEDEDEGSDGERSRQINFGRPLQPAQKVEPPPPAWVSAEPSDHQSCTPNPSDYWQLLVGDFQTCAAVIDEGYVEDAFGGVNSGEYVEDVTEVFGARERDIQWITPVLDEHFTYHGSVLAGANTACEVCFYSTAALLVGVPDRSAHGKAAGSR